MAYLRDNHERFGDGIYRLVSANNPEFPEGACWDLYNMVYERASSDPEKMRGYTQIGTTARGGAISGLFDYDEGTRLIATSEDGKISERTSGDWSESTGGTGFDSSSGTRWSGTMFHGATTGEDILLLCNSASADAPQKYRSTNGISALGGSPPATGQFPVPFAGRVWMAAGTTLHFSAADNAEDWTTNGGSFACDKGTGAITGLYNFMGNLLIFKRRKILRLLPGTQLASTNIRELSSKIGTASHYTIQEAAGSSRSASLFFESDTGIQELVPTNAIGGFYIRNVADQIKPLLNSRDKTNLATNWATFNEDRGEYWLQVCTANNSPDRGYIGNVALGKKPRWSQHDMRNKTAGTMYRVSGEELQVIGDTGGRVYQMHVGDARDGAGYRGTFWSPAWSQGDRFRMKKYGRVAVDFSTNGSYGVDLAINLGRAALPSPRGNSASPSGFGSTDGWGVGEFGVAQWGGTVVSGQWVRPTKVVRGSFMKISAQTLGSNQWFRVNGMSLEYVNRRQIMAA